MDNGQPTAPPGWYFDGHATRWWDGAQWGVYAPTSAPGVDSNDKTLAVLAHLGTFVGGFILPLIFYLISNEQNRPMTRWHAREALNFQITFLIAYLLGFAVFMVAIIGSASSESAAFGLLAFPLLFLILGGSWVMSIIGAIKASKNEQWRYPVCIRFVKG
jgi:uncharacterized protein